MADEVRESSSVGVVAVIAIIVLILIVGVFLYRWGGFGAAADNTNGIDVDLNAPLPGGTDGGTNGGGTTQ